MLRSSLLSCLALSFLMVGSPIVGAVESSVKAKGQKAAKADLIYVCHGGKIAKVIVNTTGPGSFKFDFDRSKCDTEWSSQS